MSCCCVLCCVVLCCLLSVYVLVVCVRIVYVVVYGLIVVLMSFDSSHADFMNLGWFETPSCLHFSICACHPCAGAMLIFSASFQCKRMIPEGNPARLLDNGTNQNHTNNNHNNTYKKLCCVLCQVFVCCVLLMCFN